MGFFLMMGLIVVSFKPIQAQTINYCNTQGSQYFWYTTNSPSYAVEFNYWNGSCPGTQCMNVNTATGDFSVTEFTASCGNNVATYPAIYYGNHFTNLSNNANIPMLLSAVTCATSSWNYTVNMGNYDVAYDIWFSTSATNITTSGYPGGAELMIWLNSNNAYPSGGTPKATVTLDGYTFYVYETISGSAPNTWTYIAYDPIGPINGGVTNLNLLAFFNDAESRIDSTSGKPYISTSWYLADIEAGIEIHSGGSTFNYTSSGFSAYVNSGCGTGPTYTFTHTGTMTNSPTRTPSPTITRTSTPTPTRTFTGTSTPTPTTTVTPTVTNSPTPWPTNVPTFTPTNTATDTLTMTPTATPTITNSPTPWPTGIPTFTPTDSPTMTPTGTNTPIPLPTSTSTNNGPAPPCVNLFPNPLKGDGYTNISICPSGHPYVGRVTVSVFTVAFRRVAGWDIPAWTPGNDIQLPSLDLGGVPLANGLYYVVVDMSGNKTVLKWLIFR